MVNTSELWGVIAKNGKTQSDVAKMLYYIQNFLSAYAKRCVWK